MRRSDDRAIPKIFDFGVAKAINQRLTEKTVFTEQGRLIGTPEYMSPEQAEMTAQDIDTRSDIYALGVLLYELLTGSVPFDAKTLRKAGLAEIVRIIREVDPRNPAPASAFWRTTAPTRLLKSPGTGGRTPGRTVAAFQGISTGSR